MFGWKRKLTFNILICVGKDGDAYHAFCPALKGVHVDGETFDKAVENVKVAVVLYIKSLIKHGDPIPIQIIQSEETQEFCQTSQPGKAPICPHPLTEQVYVQV